MDNEIGKIRGKKFYHSDFINIFALLSEYRKNLILFVLISLILFIIITLVIPKKYSSEAKIVVGKVNGSLIEQYAPLMEYIGSAIPKGDSLDIINTTDGINHQGYKLRYKDIVLIIKHISQNQSGLLKRKNILLNKVIRRHDKIYNKKSSNKPRAGLTYKTSIIENKNEVIAVENNLPAAIFIFLAAEFFFLIIIISIYNYYKHLF